MEKWPTITILLLSLITLNTAEAREYYLYGEKHLGSRFRKPIYSWPVPLNRRYSKLSKKHQLIVRKQYEDLESSDIPPYPKKGVKMILKAYTQEFRYSGSAISGMLVADISAEGHASNIRSETMGGLLPSDVVWRMSSVLQKIEFDPGKCDGSPCDMTYRMQLLPVINPSSKLNAHP